MIVRTIEILLEYISIILCIHKIENLKIGINIWNIILLLIDFIVMQCVNYKVVEPYSRCLIYFLLLVYIRIMTEKNWRKSVGSFCIMMIVIVLLQVFTYYLFKIFYINIQNKGIAINSVIILFLLMWKEKYGKIIIEKIIAIKKTVIVSCYLFIFVQLLYLCNKYGHLSLSMVVQFLIEIIGLSAITILWVRSEVLSWKKMREVQMYEMYNKTFEETITTIRARQHEFENHINTIKCLQYIINNKEELIKEQERYCNEVLKETSMCQLLRLSMEPALAGFLYSKIQTATARGIEVKYSIQPIEIGDKISVYELIEIIGILFDNAVEALEGNDNKIILINIVNGEEKNFWLEIGNISRTYQNNEIEKFFKYNYSTKGQDRGVGLSRICEILKKNKSIIEVGNYEYEGNNYLKFKIIFER